MAAAGPVSESALRRCRAPPARWASERVGRCAVLDEARAPEAGRVLQRRQRFGEDSGGLSAGERGDRANLPGVDQAVRESRHDDAHDCRTPAGPTTCRSMRSGSPASSSSRISSSTTPGRTTRTWTSTIVCRPADMMKNAVIVATFVVPRGEPGMRCCRASHSEGAAITAAAGDFDDEPDQEMQHAHVPRGPRHTTTGAIQCGSRFTRRRVRHARGRDRTPARWIPRPCPSENVVQRLSSY